MTQTTGLSAPFCRFVDDVELSGEADALKGKDAGQGDFDRCGKCELCEAKQGQEQGPALHQQRDSTQQFLPWVKHSTWGN